MSVDGQIVSVKLEKFVHKRQSVSVDDKMCPRGAKNCPGATKLSVDWKSVSVGNNRVRGREKFGEGVAVVSFSFFISPYMV